MSAPAIFVIGDSLAFRCVNVTSERSGQPLPLATLTYTFTDADTREQVTSGNMVLYDAPSASFEGTIPDTVLDEYDPNTNPDGIVPERQYILKTTIDNAGTKTSKARRLIAKLDPPDEEP